MRCPVFLNVLSGNPSAIRRLQTSVSLLASSNDRSRALRTPQVNSEFSNANIENVTKRSR